MWSRRDFDLAPRFISSFIEDSNYDERAMLASEHDVKRTPHDYLECVTNSRIGTKLPTGIFSLLLDAMLSDVTKAHGKTSAQGIIASIDKAYFSHDPYHFDTAAPTKSGGIIAHAVAKKGLEIIIAPSCEFTKDGKTAVFKDVTFKGNCPEQIREVFVNDIDLVIVCTGYRLNFEWLNAGMNVDANPRKWYKHCFPPGLGDKLAFLGYARPAQGGIPQCSEMLARYTGLLIKGDRRLPENYAQLADIEGKCEDEIFYLTPHATSLVDFASFTCSIARLIGCEPDLVFMSPSRLIKYMTLPLWTIFYRLRGPGADPQACWSIVDQFGIFDSFPPMPLAAIYTVFGVLLMEPLKLADYICSPLIDAGQPKDALFPRKKDWRIGGHFYQLSGNKMRVKDACASAARTALLGLTMYGLSKGIFWLGNFASIKREL